jgi:tetratricopeptide (TPR) repeat protein
MSEAIPLCEQTLADRARILGDEHPDTLKSRNNLAFVYQEAGRADAAIPMYEQALAGLERVLGERHPDTVLVRENLAGARQEAGEQHDDRARLG